MLMSVCGGRVLRDCLIKFGCVHRMKCWRVSRPKKTSSSKSRSTGSWAKAESSISAPSTSWAEAVLPSSRNEADHEQNLHVLAGCQRNILYISPGERPDDRSAPNLTVS